MGFWIFMLATACFIPLLMLAVGLRFRKKAPKSINYLFGYRTELSMKNKETWEFAHRYIGRLWTLLGAALLPVSALIMALVYGKSEDTVGIVGVLCLTLPLVFIIVTIALTESALKRSFDENGNKRD